MTASKRPLTEVELEVMHALWSLEPCSIRVVHQQLQQARPVAYTTIATIMKILEQKGVLKSESGEKLGEKGHVYSARMSRVEYEAQSVKHLTQEVFGGDSSGLVMRLLDDRELSAKTLESIKSLVDEKLRAQGKSKVSGATRSRTR